MVKSLIPLPIPFGIQYAIWHEAIKMFFGDWLAWRYAKYRFPLEIYNELCSDMMGCYCMGGEL